MFRNKHVIIAMLVTPLLAILTWFAVGALVGEKAEPARSGQSYPLVEKSSCRYARRVCELANGDLLITLTLRSDESVGLGLKLRSSHALDRVQMAVAAADTEPAPRSMLSEGDAGLDWYLPLAEMPGEERRIRLVATRAGSTFFADASTTFLSPEGQTR